MKLKIAFSQLASCWGCHQSLLDLHLDLLDILSISEIVFWPAVVDTKESQLEALPNGSIDIGFVEGHIRTEHDIFMLKLMREKCKVLLAWGACATHGGITGLANLYSIDENTKRKFITADSVIENKSIPNVNVPAFVEKVVPNKEYVKFDGMLFGCPPTSDNIRAAIFALVPFFTNKNYLETNVCEVCDLRYSNDCFLKRELACFGSVTGAPPGLKWDASKGIVMGEYGPTHNIAQPEANYLLDLAARSVMISTEETTKISIEFITLYFRLPSMGQLYLSADILQLAGQHMSLPTKMIGPILAVDLNALTSYMVGPAFLSKFKEIPEIVKDIIGIGLSYLTKTKMFEPGLRTVCNHCNRNIGEIKLLGYKRDYEGIIKPKKCLLNQGYICIGFLTNAGCGARCPNAGAPCIGCFGISIELENNPIAFISRLRSIIRYSSVDELIKKMEDPVGVFYKSNYPRTKISELIKKSE